MIAIDLSSPLIDRGTLAMPRERDRPRRCIPVPPNEPAATLRQWRHAWEALSHPLGPELDIETAGELLGIYDRLRWFGVVFEPEWERRMADLRRSGIAQDQDDNFSDCSDPFD